jgi:4-cresol dehydrogenase (hydroxylating)
MVDLAMNRVLEVNDKRFYALVEPGVRTSIFTATSRTMDSGVVDTPDPVGAHPLATRSITASATRWVSIGDHRRAHCGMEVVLPNGEIMRTGMGALPQSKSWQEYKHGFGPDPAGLFGQGNFGIVTKMGFRLMPQPEHWRTGAVMVPKRQDLSPLVDTVNYLTDLAIMASPGTATIWR